MIDMRIDVDFKDIMDEVKNLVSGEKARVVQKCIDAAIDMSPVYRGRFRRAWRVSYGYPQAVSVNSGGTPTSPLPKPKIKVSRFDTVLKTDAFITNGQPYAEALENGSSSQAPQGILRRIAAMDL